MTGHRGVSMISRRQLVIALGASSIAAPFGSFAQQQGKVWRIGFLFAGTLAQRPQAQGFWEGLKELGYVTGKNILIEIREAEGKTEKLPDLAKELVSWKPDVIAVSYTHLRAHETPEHLVCRLLLE